MRRSAAGHPTGDTVPVSGDVPHPVWRSGVAHGVSLSETRPSATGPPTSNMAACGGGSMRGASGAATLAATMPRIDSRWAVISVAQVARYKRLKLLALVITW